MTTESKPILIGKRTYGYYFEDASTFRCSHGGWSSQITLINDHECDVKDLNGQMKYKFIDSIPEGWDYT